MKRQLTAGSDDGAGGWSRTSVEDELAKLKAGAEMKGELIGPAGAGPAGDGLGGGRSRGSRSTRPQ